MIVLVGSKGSMGRRYQAILKHLGVKYRGFDIGDESPWEAASYSDGVIIATPTLTHSKLVRCVKGGIPILCEKPLSVDLAEVDEILQTMNPLQMMAQYRFLDPPQDGLTLYNYYQSGSDGLKWDCLTLLGLARGPVELRQTSPVWCCHLNGRVLTIELVQASYVTAVEEWLVKPEGDRAWIRMAHHRAATFPGERVAALALDGVVPKSPSDDPVSPQSGSVGLQPE